MRNPFARHKLTKLSLELKSGSVYDFHFDQETKTQIEITKALQIVDKVWQGCGQVGGYIQFKSHFFNPAEISVYRLKTVKSFRKNRP